jgi:hypothetical protein
MISNNVSDIQSESIITNGSNVFNNLHEELSSSFLSNTSMASSIKRKKRKLNNGEVYWKFEDNNVLKKEIKKLKVNKKIADITLIKMKTCFHQIVAFKQIETRKK